MLDLRSPSGLIGVRVEEKNGGWPGLRVSFGGRALFACSLGIHTNRAAKADGFQLREAQTADIAEDYSLPAGKSNRYQNRGRELLLHFASGDALRLRAYDNGVAFRYELSQRDDHLQIEGEDTAFVFEEEPEVFAQELVPTYELPYLHREWGHMVGQRYGMPMLLRYPARGPQLLLSEAELLSTKGNYCSCHLVGGKGKSLFIAYAPEDRGAAMPVHQPFASPWRMVTIAPDLDALVRSHLAQDLNPPAETTPDWIQPARALWAWWAYENGAQLYTQSRDYVDYAAQMGFEALTLDCGWDADWTPNLCAYAKEKGVQIWLWTGMQRVDTLEKAQRLLPLWASWGVKGLKIDFFENDSQHTMGVYGMLAELALQHKLMLNFHGSTKPMGEGRTWPHFLTAEGIMGLEHYKWSNMPNSLHNCTVPFTRNVSGPMDYTPLGFANRNRNTTHAHQLALTTVFESGITHYSLSLFELEAWAGTNYLRRSKASYDEVRLLSGEPGDHVTMLRRKGEEYFVGAIVTRGRLQAIDLGFLPDGNFQAEIYEDDGSDQMLRIRTVAVTNKDTLQLKLRENGGAAIYLARAIKPLETAAVMELPAAQMRTRGGSEPFRWADGTQGILLAGAAEVHLPQRLPPNTLLKLFYACDEPCEVDILCGSVATRVLLPATASRWDKVTFYVPLSIPEGAHSLRFVRVSGGICELEKVQALEGSLHAGTAYPAKVAQLRGGAELGEKRSGAVDIVGAGDKADIVFDQVQADKSGWHVMAITYCSGENRDISIEVNGAGRIDTYLHSTAGWFFPTWENAEDKEVLVYLKEGQNSIRLFNEKGKLSHIRGIRVAWDEDTNRVKQQMQESKAT